jgi:hypothetical protein
VRRSKFALANYRKAVYIPITEILESRAREADVWSTLFG